MKNLRRLACKFDLDQSEGKSSQVNASAHKPWPNGVASVPKFSTCVYLRCRLTRALVSQVIDQLLLEFSFNNRDQAHRKKYVNSYKEIISGILCSNYLVVAYFP